MYSILDELFMTPDELRQRREREAVGAAVLTVVAGAAIVYNLMAGTVRYRVSKRRMNKAMDDIIK